MVLEVVSVWPREREIRKPLCRKQSTDNKYFDVTCRERKRLQRKLQGQECEQHMTPSISPTQILTMQTYKPQIRQIMETHYIKESFCFSFHIITTQCAFQLQKLFVSNSQQFIPTEQNFKALNSILKGVFYIFFLNRYMVFLAS